MASRIRIKRSDVAGKVPQAGDLELGELAINTHDGRLFARRDNGTPSIHEIGAGVPVGVITLWSGPVTNIPQGWVLCDGTNGTPDLRGRFIVGGGGNYTVGATGGRNAISEVPSHSHTVSGTTSSGGAHSHTGTTSTYGGHRPDNTTAQNRSRSSDNRNYITKQLTGRGSGIAGSNRYIFNVVGAHSHSFSTNTGGAHSHSFSATTSATGVASVDTRPPYFALCYIMKV